METIIVHLKDAEQAKAVLDVLKKLNVEAKVFPVPTKKETFDTIERGADDVSRHSKGEIELKDAKQLLNELLDCSHA